MDVRRFLAVLLPLLALVACSRARTSDAELILLISVDTLRADRLTTYGQRQLDLTPSIDALSKDAVVFERAYVPSSFTLPAVSAMHTGRYPEENGIFSNEYVVPPDVPTIASVLREAGWSTGAVVSNYVLREDCGINRGFDAFDATFPEREAVRSLPERVAPQTTRDALGMLNEMLAEGSEKIFLWVHYQDPHGPYTPTRRARDEFLGAERMELDGGHQLEVGRDHRGLGSIPDYQYDGQREVAWYRAGYDAEVKAMDDAVGQLMAGLRDHGLDQRATIVFTADHGEGLGENDYWFAHGEHLTDPLIQVPLFFRVPGMESGRRNDVACVTDLLATLCGLVGIEHSKRPSTRGRDLFGPGAEAISSPIYLATLAGSSVPRVGLIENDFKLILTRRPKDILGQLFQLGQEDRDLISLDKQRARVMREKLQKMIASLERHVPIPQVITPEVRKNLDGLGYTGDEEGD